MIKLKSGYYQYKPNTGITFLDTHLYVCELHKDTVLVLPSLFHKIANNTDTDNETPSHAITFFKHNDDFLADLNFTHNIGGLHDY